MSTTALLNDNGSNASNTEKVSGSVAGVGITLCRLNEMTSKSLQHILAAQVNSRYVLITRLVTREESTSAVGTLTVRLNTPGDQNVQTTSTSINPLYRAAATLQEPGSANREKTHFAWADVGIHDLSSDCDFQSLIVVEDICNGTDPMSANNADQNGRTAAKIISYVIELFRLIHDELAVDVKRLQGTEQVIGQICEPVIPSFQAHNYPSCGTGIMLIIPTANKFKSNLLRETFEKRAPRKARILSLSKPFDSGVGEQPYNEAGIEGAINRINNALYYFDDPENQQVFRQHNIGQVFIASIENFIQTENSKKPTDYGVMVVCNAKTGTTNACISQGVTIPDNYVKRARRFGFGASPNHGRVTVGKVIAAHVPGIDGANWHEVLAGRSRYKLLMDAIERLQIPW